MFNKKEFEDIYQSIKNNQKDKAQKNLKFFREKYDLDPDYLYLHTLLEQHLFLLS